MLRNLLIATLTVWLGGAAMAQAKTTWLSCSVVHMAGDMPSATLTFAFDDVDSKASMVLNGASHTGAAKISPTLISALVRPGALSGED
jgi:hypothetical protein